MAGDAAVWGVDEELGDEVCCCRFKGGPLFCLGRKFFDAGRGDVIVGVLHDAVRGRDCLQSQGTEVRVSVPLLPLQWPPLGLVLASFSNQIKSQGLLYSS